jgi:hypothetical protein
MTNQTIATTATAQKARELAEQAGLTGSALELAVRAGGRQRHNLRVLWTLEAAFALAGAGERANEVAQEVLADREGRVPSGLLTDIRADALLFIVTDLNGVNGPDGAGMEQGSTGRFLDHGRELGTGRWYAGDGQAYRVAALEAVRAIVRTTTPNAWGTGVVRISIERSGNDPKGDNTLIRVNGEASTCDPYPAYDLALMRRIVMALARGETELHFGAGHWQRFAVYIDGDIALWGERLNYLEAVVEAASNE